eukprot:15066838-Alexandrium_andersonii.AAC.1
MRAQSAARVAGPSRQVPVCCMRPPPRANTALRTRRRMCVRCEPWAQRAWRARVARAVRAQARAL